MLAFPGMIAEAARKAGMKVPPEPDGEWNADEYPHFDVYCKVQLGRPIQWGEHWTNAKIVAAVSDGKIQTVTLDELLVEGLIFQT